MPTDDTLRRIDNLRKAIDVAVDGLNDAWSGFGPSEALESVITGLQHARTKDDIAQGRDWPPAIAAKPTDRPDPLREAAAEMHRMLFPAGKPGHHELGDDLACHWCRAALAASGAVTEGLSPDVLREALRLLWSLTSRDVRAQYEEAGGPDIDAILAASGAVTEGLPSRRDMAETLCFLAGHGQEHPDHPSCPKNRHEADRIVRTLSARRDFSARLAGVADLYPKGGRS